MAEDGLSDAVSLQGGSLLIPHVNHPRDLVEIEIEFARAGPAEGIADLFLTDVGDVEFSDQRTAYSVKLDLSSASAPRVDSEQLRVYFRCSSAKRPAPNRTELENNATVTLIRRRDALDVDFKVPPHLNPQRSPVFEYLMKSWRPTLDTTLLDQRNSLLNFQPSAYLKDIPIFDLNPDLAREAVFTTGKTELASDGENLPIVLRRILDNPGDARKYRLLLRHLIAYAGDIATETFSDLTTVMEVRDSFLERTLPSTALSSGTIFAAALIAAIYFEAAPVVCLEEPDRYLHGGVLPKLAELIKSRSSERQFLITTHNSTFIRQFDPKESNFICVYRTPAGETNVTTPQTSEKISQFLMSHVDLATLNEDSLLTD